MADTAVHQTTISDGITIKEQYVSSRAILSKSPTSSKARKSIQDLIDDEKESDRILGYIVGGKAVKHYMITDFNSFKEAFRDAFSRGGQNSNARLWDFLNSEEDLLLKLYGNPLIQEKVTEEGKEPRILDLQNRYKINKHEAEDMYARVRVREIELIQQGKLPTTEQVVLNAMPELPQTIVPAKRQIQQNRGGTIYRRSIPQKYQAPQKRFLLNNAGVPTRQLVMSFNQLFHDSRTISSVYNQRYRLLKAQAQSNMPAMAEQQEVR